MKQLKVLNENEFIDNKLYFYLKPTDLPVPRFHVNQKYTMQEFLNVLFFHIVEKLYGLDKYIAKILKAYVKEENNNAKNSITFFNYIRNIPDI